MAYATNCDRLDLTLPTIIKHGVATETAVDDEAVPVARENQILSDAQVAALLRGRTSNGR